MKYIYNTLIFCLTFLFVPTGFSQLDPDIYQFAQNRFMLNPACAGFENKLEGSMLHNFLLPKIVDAPTMKNLSPRNTLLGIGAPIPNFITGKKGEFAGASFSYIHRKSGYETFDAFRIGLNKYIALGDSSSLRIGVEWQFQQLGIAFSYLIPHDTLDPLVPRFDQSDRNNTCNFGVFYSTKEWHDLYLGISMTHIPAESFAYTTPRGQAIKIQVLRQYYIMSGMKFREIFNLPNLDLRTDIMVTTRSFSRHFVTPVGFIQAVASYKQIMDFGMVLHNVNRSLPRPAYIGAILGISPLQPVLEKSGSTLRLGYTIIPYFINPIFSGFQGKRFTHEFSLNYSLQLN
jgi:type IX secretion system PorP/SprF family membrane protein